MLCAPCMVGITSVDIFMGAIPPITPHDASEVRILVNRLTMIHSVEERVLHGRELWQDEAVGRQGRISPQREGRRDGEGVARAVGH